MVSGVLNLVSWDFYFLLRGSRVGFKVLYLVSWGYKLYLVSGGANLVLGLFFLIIEGTRVGFRELYLVSIAYRWLQWFRGGFRG